MSGERSVTADDLLARARALVETDQNTAYRLLIAACEADPRHGEAWRFLGAALADLGSLPASVAALRRALACDLADDSRLRALVNLAHRMVDYRVVTLDAAREAIGYCRQALMLAGDVAVRAFAHTNWSLCAAHLGDHEAEVEHAEAGFRLCPDPPTELGVGFAYLFNGRYREGLERFEARFPHKLRQFLELPWPRWGGEWTDRLFVMADMGLGDTLSMARFVPDAAARVCEVLVQAQSELVTLLRDAFRDLPNVRVIPQEYSFPEGVSAWCPVFSLPVPLGLSDAEIGGRRWVVPVRACDDRSWKKAARKHVAVAWAGSAANDIDRHRSIPLTALLPLAEDPGVALYSVQVGERARDMHDAGAAALARDLSPWIRDARDTASILAEMDVVVACESFAGHLAGAIDVPCWLLCSRLGRDWRSAPRLGDRTLWYPATRVFRQGDDCAWEPVVREVGGWLRR